jgi:hypothetical protein
MGLKNMELPKRVRVSVCDHSHWGGKRLPLRIEVHNGVFRSGQPWSLALGPYVPRLNKFSAHFLPGQINEHTTFDYVHGGFSHGG